VKEIKKQRGIMLLAFVAVLLTAATVTIKALNHGNTQIDRDKITAAALAQAKDALIGYAITYQDTHPHVPSYMNGYLPNPDMGPGNSTEGSTASSFAGNTRDYSVIGKLPWKTLGMSPLRDGNGECLWYVLSGHFKNTPPTTALNWDTPGQIDIMDGNGNSIASNIAALIIAPGKPLDGQSHTLVGTNPQCGGNYDARNYLDPYNIADAISGTINYFSGSTNNSRAPDTSNKTLLLTGNDHHNDRLLLISASELFQSIIHRNNFIKQINDLMNDSAFQHMLESITVSVSNKGTNNIDCSNTSNADNQNFCNNWKEMLLLTELPAPAAITIDGTATSTCTRVLIFGGQKIGAQVRLTDADKSNPANYLEAPNLAAFAVPIAASGNFNGVSNFSSSNPSADLLRCL
jgi:hypothetical protein